MKRHVAADIRTTTDQYCDIMARTAGLETISPSPSHLCSVVALCGSCRHAMPVVAQTLTVLLAGNAEIMAANVADLPVPAWPQIQTLWPVSARCTHCFCASLSSILHAITGNKVLPLQ